MAQPSPWFAAPALALLWLAPIVAIEWSYRAALRRGAGDPTRGWFYGAIQLQWIALLAWTTWALALSLPAVTAFWLTPVPAAWRGTALIAGTFVPPLVVMALARRRIAGLSQRLRGAAPLGSNSAQALRLLLAIVVLGGTLFAIPQLALHGLAPLPWLAGGLALSLAILLVRRRGQPELSPYAVTSGDLRDRLFALAARAGVRPRQLYLLPYARARLANAFAVRSHTVMVTDYLLTHLGRDEVDAVMAHELAHLQRQHPRTLALALLGGVAAAALLMSLAGASAAVLLFWPLLLPAWFALTRRFEYAADEGAVALGASPEALISGLARLARVNHVPLAWSPRLELLVTHPSVERRARAIGARGGLTPGRIAELLSSEAAATDHYAPPPPAAVAGRVFSSAWKARAQARLVARLLVLDVAIPAAVLAFARELGWPYAAAFPAAAVAAALGAILLVMLSSPRLFDALRRPLAAQLEARGFGERAQDGRFIGWAPLGEMRLYEGFTIWDVGFLALRGDSLEFHGEEAVFALARSDIERVEVAAAGFSWAPSGAVRLEWRDARQERHAMRLVSLDAADGPVRRRARALAERLESWRREGGSAGATISALEAPPTREVTSRSPAELGRPRALIGPAVFYALLAAVAATGLRLPLVPGHGAGLFEIWFAALAAHAVLMLPIWFRREAPREPRAEDESTRQAA